MINSIDEKRSHTQLDSRTSVGPVSYRITCLCRTVRKTVDAELITLALHLYNHL